MELTVDEGTIILVAEVLRRERGLEKPPVSDAVEAIKLAVQRFGNAGAKIVDDDHV